MTIESLGTVVASAAGTPLAQSTGADVERALLATIAAQRKVAAAEQADRAAGIAQPDGDDLEPNDRDADGRAAWIFRQGRRSAESTNSAAPRPYSDAGDEPGRTLDVTG